ncbi:unnamed protein product, partial [Mesorhabditis belari]|uniref:HECT-type E3 ubiquitin transferase n=1 Tax=Mesorhabditis belari TaxID=2138241 RepID=A0AAF3FNN8_9BILA
MFKEAFGCGSALSALARKMVLILESTEKFPQYLYDAPGGSAFGLQLLSRRFRLKLELAGSDTEAQKHLLNRTNRFFKSEPLTTIGQLKNFLLKMVAKQWYDRERETFNFVKQIQKEKELSFTYTSDFDDQGIVYWLGTNGRTNSEWNNPASISIVKVSCSDAPRQPFGRPEDILSREIQPLNCHSSDDKNGNFTVDLGCLVAPTAYTLRHARGYGRSALRNWLFQGSRDNHVWELLVAHSDDTSLGDPGSTATWPIEPGKGPYRYFRVSQNGKNSSGQTYYLSLSGFEIYGKVTDVIIEGFKVEEKEKKTPPSKAPAKMTPARGSKKGDEYAHKHSARLLRNMPGDTSELVGMVVRRGPDWQWDEQDGRMNGRVITYTKTWYVKRVAVSC